MPAPRAEEPPPPTPTAPPPSDPAPPSVGQIARELIVDPHHGPLPALLLALTAVTGIVDAVSILALGRVFVANMTGNVVFVGFALAGAPGFSLAASLSALAGFLLGAAGGGRLVNKIGARRPLLVRTGLGVEVVIMAAALAISTASHGALPGGARDGIAALAAVALGGQNAVVRALKVPDLTTTVLTMTLTGIAADIRRESRATTVRRVLAVATMLGGAVGGGALVLHGGRSAALGLAVGLLGVAWLAALIAGRRRPWT